MHGRSGGSVSLFIGRERMTAYYRVCASCGHANEERAYACIECRSSLSGTIPGPLPERAAAVQPPEPDTFALWAAETETAITGAEARCHSCQATGSVVHFPFALAKTGLEFDWSRVVASAAASVLLAPVGIGILAWRWRERGLAFRMNLVLCPECAFDREDFYGRVSRDSYRLHPCYAELEDHGFVKFVGETEFKNWEDSPPQQHTGAIPPPVRRVS
jgi:hypothetical protein